MNSINSLNSANLLNEKSLLYLAWHGGWSVTETWTVWATVTKLTYIRNERLDKLKNAQRTT